MSEPPTEGPAPEQAPPTPPPPAEKKAAGTTEGCGCFTIAAVFVAFSLISDLDRENDQMAEAVARQAREIAALRAEIAAVRAHVAMPDSVVVVIDSVSPGPAR